MTKLTQNIHPDSYSLVTTVMDGIGVAQAVRAARRIRRERGVALPILQWSADTPWEVYQYVSPTECRRVDQRHKLRPHISIMWTGGLGSDHNNWHIEVNEVADKTTRIYR